MSAQPAVKFTPEEYLAIERQNAFKSEYWKGEMFAMAGATRKHNLIVSNVVRELSTQLKGRPCEVYANDMRVRIPRTGLYTYPDIVVVCGRPQFEDEQHDTLLNPTVIMEVLSDSTAGYDHGKKFEHYRKIESLREYLLLAQSEPFIEHYRRQPETVFWLFTDASGLPAVVELPAMQCRLALAEAYDKVAFEREE